MAPFVTLRCLEQHKCCSAIMNLPINTIVAGIGLGYADSGPTHYATEDVGVLKNMICSNIFTVSDSESSKMLAKFLVNKKIDLDELSYKPYPFLLANTFEKKITEDEKTTDYTKKRTQRSG